MLRSNSCFNDVTVLQKYAQSLIVVRAVVSVQFGSPVSMILRTTYRLIAVWSVNEGVLQVSIAMTKFDRHFKHLQLLPSLYSCRFPLLFAQPFPLLGYKTAFGATLACMQLLMISAYMAENQERCGTLRTRQQGEMPRRKNGAEKLGLALFFAFVSLSLALWGRTKRAGPIAIAP
ncbi:hypothetical protein LI328DRAFT_71497 [Trichoderma asperelloides]|nr:hypothetical protein LI328DRAFT_71497 [Trichoderma asperelloides]